jgi:hypothetical protein
MDLEEPEALIKIKEEKTRVSEAGLDDDLPEQLQMSELLELNGINVVDSLVSQGIFVMQIKKYLIYRSRNCW